MLFLYFGFFGMGSCDLQLEGIIGVVENMLFMGKKKKQFYLFIDFICDVFFMFKQWAYQEFIQEVYLYVKELLVWGFENLNFMLKGAVIVCFYFIGGWGVIMIGKNLVMILFDLFGYDIKVNFKYGLEKKGQFIIYYLFVVLEFICVNCEYVYVDVVFLLDFNVFKYINVLAGLKKGGIFIIQSDKNSLVEVWADIFKLYQKIIVDNNICLFYIDGFKIVCEEVIDFEL